jgi:ribosomal protein S18 acetylase RimI-like enzyme
MDGERMSIEYRPGGTADCPIAAEIWAESVGTLYAHHGFAGGPPPSPTPPNPFFAFTATNAPDGFWVAEQDQQPIGFAISVVHETLWYLGFLFIRPGSQKSGLGRQLLERSLQSASAAAATNRALITFAYNPVSISLYLRYGLYPREPLYAVAGSAEVVRAHLAPQTSGLAMREAAPDAALLTQLGEIDLSNFAVGRDLIHRFYFSRPDATCWLFHESGTLQGYAYTWQNGRVGPLAVRSPSDIAPVMRMAVSRAATQAGVEQITAIIPGSNEAAMDVALEARLQLVMPLLLMSAHPLPGATSYLYCSPGLM